MLKLVIADDDKFDLRYMEKLVPWEEHNISLEGAFSTGWELFEYIRLNPVDIIISDIKESRPDSLEIDITATVNADATHLINTIIWTSSNADVATVSGGKVVGMSKGVVIVASNNTNKCGSAKKFSFLALFFYACIRQGNGV